MDHLKMPKWSEKLLRHYSDRCREDVTHVTQWSDLATEMQASARQSRPGDGTGDAC